MEEQCDLQRSGNMRRDSSPLESWKVGLRAAYTTALLDSDWSKASDWCLQVYSNVPVLIRHGFSTCLLHRCII